MIVQISDPSPGCPHLAPFAPNAVRLVVVMTRFFPSTAMGGRLYVRGVGAYGPWDSAQLPYQSEDIVDQLVRSLSARKIHTLEELTAVVRQSSLPAVTVWIPEGSEDGVVEMWEKLQE